MNAAESSPLLDAMKEAGGVGGDYHGRELIRHFGDPAGEYRAATTGLAVFDRSHRVRLTVAGRAPGQMLKGVLTGVMPAAPREVGPGVLAGAATYHAMLTPKGKMISDLWALLRGDGEADGFLLDLPVAGAIAAQAALGKVLPPRFAKVEDVSAATGMLTVAGTGAADAVSRTVLEERVGPAELSALTEGEWRSLGSAASALVAIRTAEVWPEAYSIVGPADAVRALWLELLGRGARPAGLGVWSTLRVEAGRPVFGTDMDEDTIPTEAGIDARAIDHAKGCYTGQEVIVRIRDRGHVNRRLHRLELGDGPTPAAGAELLAADGSGKVVGRVTSAVESPRHGGVVALAYVARGVESATLGDREVRVPS